MQLACTVATPTCGDTCGKLLECGSHYCADKCHRGTCGSCLQVSVVLGIYSWVNTFLWKLNVHTEIIRCSEKVFIISFNIAKAYLLLHTVVEIRLHMKASVWSKTSLKSGCVGGEGADFPTYKMRTFFLISLKLTEPSINNFQLNGA